MLMTHDLRRALVHSDHAATPDMAGVDSAPVLLRGSLGMISLAIMAGLSAQFGSGSGLIVGIAGALAVAVVLPNPRRRPRLALIWIVLALALPVTVALYQPGLALGASLVMGGAGLWIVLTLAAFRHWPAA